MSLVSTYVRIDEVWYKNPVLYEDNWYLCFDDDDPPELVIHQEKQITKKERRKIVREILDKIDSTGRILSHTVSGQRLFPPNYTLFKNAISAFVELNKITKGNYKIKSDGQYFEQPNTQGVYYEL